MKNKADLPKLLAAREAAQARLDLMDAPQHKGVLARISVALRGGAEAEAQRLKSQIKALDDQREARFADLRARVQGGMQAHRGQQVLNPIRPRHEEMTAILSRHTSLMRQMNGLSTSLVHDGDAQAQAQTNEGEVR